MSERLSPLLKVLQRIWDIAWGGCGVQGLCAGELNSLCVCQLWKLSHQLLSPILFDLSLQVQQQAAKEGNCRPSQGTGKWLFCFASHVEKDWGGKTNNFSMTGPGPNKLMGYRILCNQNYSDGKNNLSMIFKNPNNVEKYKGRMCFLIFLFHPQLHSPEVIITTFMHVVRNIF